MTKELELKWELQAIAWHKIDLIFIEEGLINISTVEQSDKYTIVDCQQEYFDWWIANKSEPDDFINDSDYDHEDGCTSTSKTLHPDIDIYNVKDFSEFVRATSELYWIKEDILEIELSKLISDLNKFKAINKTRFSCDINRKINEVRLIARNIGHL